jgi:hypothetical protein
MFQHQFCDFVRHACTNSHASPVKYTTCGAGGSSHGVEGDLQYQRGLWRLRLRFDDLVMRIVWESVTIQCRWSTFGRRPMKSITGVTLVSLHG